MKNKTKKILAGACLGLVGMGCLTGCALTDDQQKALDLITEKSDEIISLLEENMQLQNSQLSKEDAVELVALAQTKLRLNRYNELYMKTTSMSYSGFFEKELGIAQSNAPIIYFKKNNDMAYVALCETDSTIKVITKADFDTSIAYHWFINNGKSNITFSSGLFDLSSNVDPLNLIELYSISSKDVVDIKTTEDGYKFNILANFYHKSGDNHIVSTYMATFEITKNADFKNCNFEVVNKSYTNDEVVLDDESQAVLDSNGLPITTVESCHNVSSILYTVEYQYENIDFSAIESKIAEIEAE